MKRDQHIEHCKQLIGFDGFPEVHDYLEQHNDGMGPKHRLILHNHYGVLHCLKNWGYLGAAAACLHIWADEVGLIQTNNGKFEIATTIGIKCPHPMPASGPAQCRDGHWLGSKEHPVALTEKEIERGYSA